MPLRLGTNVTSINAGRHLNRNTADFTRRVERLSSGLRINRGADDAAGLSVSEGMRAELLGMRQGVRNAEQGISLIQLAEGSLNEVSNMLTRMRELAVTSANSTINDRNRQGLTAEFNQLTAEIDRIALSTTYNRQTLLTGFGNQVSQVSSVSTALAGFSGVSEIGISGAVPGTYVFTDANTDDNQITLSIDQADGTTLTQSIDVGAALDRDGTTNLVATGTTFVANFDRLGVQVIMVGAGVDQGTTLKSTLPVAGAAGSIIVGTGDNAASVPVAAGEDLATTAANLDTALKTLTPAGSAVFDATLGEILIETNGHDFGEVPDTPVPGNSTPILGSKNANAYEDGRLNGRTFVVSTAEGGVLQVGANDNANNRIALNIGDMRASGAELNLTGLSVANLLSARGSISRIDEAILTVARQRGDLGAVQNRLQYTTANLGNAIENLQAAESAIRDADVAEEISAFTRSQIITQAATAMVAQANALPQNALSLLQ
ncbi:flagellin [Candidatus Latescibacterota bacterium]